MGDATKRKLQMPAWHIPYLEKHRIYELFHELARELVMQQPVDHVVFLKHILHHAAKSRDVPRIILFSAPKINCLEVGRQIAQCTGQLLISEQSIMECFTKPKQRGNLSPEQVARCLAHLVRTENAYDRGWIMAGCFKNHKEVKALLQLGIIPTHVFHLIAPTNPNLNELLYCHVHEDWPEYRRTMWNIRDTLKNSWIEIHIKQRGLHEVVTEILQFAKIRKGVAPMKPRILIIGPRGSGRKTQAKMLTESLGLVHIDFEYLLCQAWISETELGERLRKCKDEVCFRSDLLTEVINKRILEEDCLENGYVITNFPFTVTDFKYLDALDTPPNRVIFLECDLNICKERLVNRRVNAYTGSVTLLNEPQAPSILGKRLNLHPKDKTSIIDAELAYFCEHYGSLRSYCGPTASVVNGDQPQRWVHESISAIIVRAPPACPPRNATLDIAADQSGSLGSTSDSCGCSPRTSKKLDCYTATF